MARIFKQTYKQNGREWKGRKWVIEYIDGDGIRRKKTGYVDKIATAQLAAQLERDAARKKTGLIDRFAEHRERPLAAHARDWRESLIDAGATLAYAELSANRVLAVLTGIKAAFWPDLDANRVAAYLAQRRKAGLSVESSNHYLRRVKQFARWMVKGRRASESPLECLKMLNPRADRRHDRRAFEPDELRVLMEATADAPERFGMTGRDRAMLYRVAVETGLRASELRSLTVGSFALDTEPPTVAVRAAYSKHRRDDVLPLRVVLAAALRMHFAERRNDDAAFAVPPSDKTAKMLRADLADARAAWIEDARTPDERRERDESGFLQYRDDAGRVIDFHSFRHTFVTALVRGGANPKDAQQLARHSTIALTMDRYTTMRAVGELSAALAMLPDLDTHRAEKTQQWATGTCDAASRYDAAATSSHRDTRQSPSSRGASVSSSVSKQLTHDRNSPVRILSSDGIERGVGGQDGDSAHGAGAPVNIDNIDTCRHRMSANGTRPDGVAELGAVGLEPTTNGLKGRCLIL
ncbi:MAG: tyrosine-type recombinase/integrase [Phycisphaerae bacterium]